MEHKYTVMMNDNGQGGRFHARVEMTISAKSETEAITEAKRRHPSLQVCYIEQRSWLFKITAAVLFLPLLF